MFYTVYTLYALSTPLCLSCDTPSGLGMKRPYRSDLASFCGALFSKVVVAAVVRVSELGKSG